MAPTRALNNYTFLECRGPICKVGELVIQLARVPSVFGFFRDGTLIGADEGRNMLLSRPCSEDDGVLLDGWLRLDASDLPLSSPLACLRSDEDTDVILRRFDGREEPTISSLSFWEKRGGEEDGSGEDGGAGEDDSGGGMRDRRGRDEDGSISGIGDDEA